MKSPKVDNKGFSLTELMFAMTILAFGLLALAQMQMMAMRGTTSAREFSTATKIAREGMERWKITGIYVIESTTVLIHDDDFKDEDYKILEEEVAPIINSNTEVSTIGYDMIEVFKEDPNDPMSMVNPFCTARASYGSCSAEINSGDWDYVRITNIRNWPLGSEMQDSVMKEVNTIVLWEERDRTRSVSLRSLVGRKDNAFF